MKHVPILAFTSVMFFLAMLADTQAQINSPAGRTLFRKTFMWRTDLAVLRLSKLLAEGKEIADPLDRGVNVLAWQQMFVYGLTGDVSVIGVLPLVSQDINPPQAGGTRISDRTTGFADTTFLLQYDGLYKKNWIGRAARLAAFYGVKPPTGKTGFSTESTDFIYGTIFSYFGEKWWFSTDVQHMVTTEGKGIERGDEFIYDASISYRPLRAPERRDLFVLVELNGLWRGKTRRDGVRIDNSGGNTVFLSPGVEYFILPNLGLEFSWQIPVIQELREAQLGRDFNIVAGLRYVF